LAVFSCAQVGFILDTSPDIILNPQTKRLARPSFVMTVGIGCVKHGEDDRRADFIGKTRNVDLGKIAEYSDHKEKSCCGNTVIRRISE
jgi:hypothetical protein